MTSGCEMNIYRIDKRGSIMSRYCGFRQRVSLDAFPLRGFHRDDRDFSRLR